MERSHFPRFNRTNTISPGVHEREKKAQWIQKWALSITPPEMWGAARDGDHETAAAKHLHLENMLERGEFPELQDVCDYLDLARTTQVESELKVMGEMGIRLMLHCPEDDRASAVAAMLGRAYGHAAERSAWKKFSDAPPDSFMDPCEMNLFVNSDLCDIVETTPEVRTVMDLIKETNKTQKLEDRYARWTEYPTLDHGWGDLPDLQVQARHTPGQTRSCTQEQETVQRWGSSIAARASDSSHDITAALRLDLERMLSREECPELQEISNYLNSARSARTEGELKSLGEMCIRLMCQFRDEDRALAVAAMVGRAFGYAAEDIACMKFLDAPPEHPRDEAGRMHLFVDWELCSMDMVARMRDAMDLIELTNKIQGLESRYSRWTEDPASDHSWDDLADVHVHGIARLAMEKAEAWRDMGELPPDSSDLHPSRRLRTESGAGAVMAGAYPFQMDVPAAWLQPGPAQASMPQAQHLAKDMDVDPK